MILNYILLFTFYFKMIRKFLKILIGLAVIFAVVVGLTSINHPIILKWLIGSARIIGKPVKALIYTNGKLNSKVKIYKTDNYWSRENNNKFLLYFPDYDRQGKLKFINIDLKDKWVGRPVGTGKDDYDFINRVLFQSEVGGHFIDFRNDIKGYGFDPQITFNDSQIKFNVPPNQLNFDSLRIELNK